MAEPNAVVDVQEPGFPRGSQRAWVDGESFGRAPQQRRVPQRLRRRQQCQALRRVGQSDDPPQVPVFQPTRKIARRGWCKAPGSL